jgi:hypothetical protein
MKRLNKVDKAERESRKMEVHSIHGDREEFELITTEAQ